MNIKISEKIITPISGNDGIKKQAFEKSNTHAVKAKIKVA